MLPTRAIPNHIFLEEVRVQLNAGHSATFRVKGWSMRPFLEHARDKVLLVSPNKRQVKNGEVILALTIDNRYVLHRVVSIDSSGNCHLSGDGNVHGKEKCTPENVIGVAQGFYIGESEHYYDVDGWVWRCYSYFWMHTSLIRRWLLLVYRVFFKLFGTERE